MAKATKKAVKKNARKPVKAARAKRPAKAAAKPASDVVYSDLRRDALAWQLAKLR